MQMATAMMAFQRQAAAWVASTRAALGERGLGVGAELAAEAAAQAASHPTPTGYDPQDPEVARQARELAQQALTADYPAEGIPPDDPRLEPIEAMTLAIAAMAAKVVGFSDDEAFRGRVAGAFGFDLATYDRAAAAWRERVAADVVLSAFYGQLYAAA